MVKYLEEQVAKRNKRMVHTFKHQEMEMVPRAQTQWHIDRDLQWQFCKKGKDKKTTTKQTKIKTYVF